MLYVTAYEFLSLDGQSEAPQARACSLADPDRAPERIRSEDGVFLFLRS